MSKYIGLSQDELISVLESTLSKLDIEDVFSKAIYDSLKDYPDLAAILSDNEKMIVKTLGIVSNRIIFAITPALIATVVTENNKAISKAFESHQ